MQMRPGIDLVPSPAVFGHGRRIRAVAVAVPTYSRLLSPDVLVRHAVCADAPNPNAPGPNAGITITGAFVPSRSYHGQLGPAMQPRGTGV